MQVRFPGWEDALEEGMTTHTSILAWRIPMERGAWRTTVHGVTKELDMTEHMSMHSPSMFRHPYPLRGRYAYHLILLERKAPLWSESHRFRLDSHIPSSPGTFLRLLSLSETQFPHL